jgi:hypothetical protein
VELDDRVVELVRQVKAAIMDAEVAEEDRKLRVTQVDLELKAVFSKGVGGEATVLKIVELGGSLSSEDAQMINISLVPQPQAIELMAAVDEELKEGIKVVKAAVREAAASAPMFALREGKVEVKLGITKEGKVRLFFGPEGKSEDAHKATLTLMPA